MQTKMNVIITKMNDMFSSTLSDVNDNERNDIYRLLQENKDGVTELITALEISTQFDEHSRQLNALASTIISTINKERARRSDDIVTLMTAQISHTAKVAQAQRDINAFFTTVNAKLAECERKDNRTVLHQHLVSSNAIRAFELVIGLSDPEAIIDKLGDLYGIEL